MFAANVTQKTVNFARQAGTLSTPALLHMVDEPDQVLGFQHLFTHWACVLLIDRVPMLPMLQSGVAMSLRSVQIQILFGLKHCVTNPAAPDELDHFPKQNLAKLVQSFSFRFPHHL